MSETFVLIHGAWHGGWTWRPVATELRRAGCKVFALNLPGVADGADPRKYTLADVVDYIVDFVDSRDLRDVTMVGHSWGGYPLTGAAQQLSARLRKLVYWSAFVPNEGVPLIEEVPPAYKETFTDLAAASGNNTVTLPYEIFSTAFIQDAEENVRKLVHSLLVPHPMQYFTEPVASARPSELGIPASYVISGDDISLPPGEYAFMPRFPDRLGDVPVIETPGSHEANFTRPAELAQTLLKA